MSLERSKAGPTAIAPSPVNRASVGPTASPAAAGVDVDVLQKQLGYQFNDRSLLLQSLTHTSYGHEFLQEKNFTLRDNERLEFLGDAILDVIVSDILLEMFPAANEGHLSKMRAAVVNEKTLSEVAKSTGLQAYVRLGKGEIQSGGALKPSILSSAFEALMAAIYLDGGFAAVYPVVRHLFAPLFGTKAPTLPGAVSTFTVFNDYKTQLQESVQAKWKVTPTYHLLGTQGPDHAKTFEVEVRMDGKGLASAMGRSKKEAEQNAARVAAESLDLE